MWNHFSSTQRTCKKKDCSRSMLVLTIRPYMSHILETFGSTRIACFRLAVEGALDLYYHLHENAVLKVVLTARSTGTLLLRQKGTSTHLSSSPLFQQKKTWLLARLATGSIGIVTHLHLKIMTFQFPPLPCMPLKVPRRSRQRLPQSMVPSSPKKKIMSLPSHKSTILKYPQKPNVHL